MSEDLNTWAKDISHLPIAFSQVREDAEIDLEVLSSTPSPMSGVIVASGGCTVATLLALLNISKLYVVDPNPAQIVLTKLKLKMLSSLEPNERLALLGHTPMKSSSRINWVTENCHELKLDIDQLGPQKLWAEKGLDYSGRYEVVFEKLRFFLNKFQSEINNIFLSKNHITPDQDYLNHLEQAFEKTMSQDHLVTVFGEKATANRVQEFSQHFFKRTLHAFKSTSYSQNPYLAQVLLGKYINKVYPTWLNQQKKDETHNITYICQTMIKTLNSLENKVDFIHLSNILDWLSIKEASQTLNSAYSSLSSGGKVIIRQLNSSIDIPSLNSSFDWNIETSQSLHKKDRSYFYNHIYLGYKK